MNRAFTEMQVANEAQTPNWTNTLLKTPLGEPMNQESASILALDPVEWHLQHWLAIAIIAIMRGEDPVLTVIRIDIEVHKMADTEIKTGIQSGWKKNRLENGEQCQRYFSAFPKPTEEVNQYLRDIDRMLADKGQKTRDYLEKAEKEMFILIRERRFDTARIYSANIARVYRHLQEEVAREARATNQLPNSTDDVHNQLSEFPEIIDAEQVDNDDEMADDNDSGWDSVG